MFELMCLLMLAKPKYVVLRYCHGNANFFIFAQCALIRSPARERSTIWRPQGFHYFKQSKNQPRWLMWTATWRDVNTKYLRSEESVIVNFWFHSCIVWPVLISSNIENVSKGPRHFGIYGSVVGLPKFTLMKISQ